MKHYEYTLININEIKPYEKNARLHSKEQIEQVKASIKEFGFTNPLLVDEDFNLIAGHCRLEAIKQLNRSTKEPIENLPAIVLEGLSETQKKALVLADNKLALNSTWDFAILQDELRELDNLNFCLDLIGFSKFEIDDILGEFEAENKDNGFNNSVYSTKIDTPIYEPQRDTKPHIKELYNAGKAKELLRLIDKVQDENLRDFLICACYRFVDFDFSNIAEYYARADKETQELFEKLLLVFIDINSAIENGYIESTKIIGEILENDE